MHRRRAVISAIIAAIVVFIGTGLGMAGPAYAEGPVTFGNGRVVDQAGVLGDKAADVDEATRTLQKEHGIRLFVAYVDTFTSPTAAKSWADATAEQNGLTSNDYLLAVAVQSRTYYLSADAAGPVSSQALANIRTQQIEP